MSIGRPKKFKKLEKMKQALQKEEKSEVTRVYKDKNSETKKALKFKTDRDRSKLA